MRPIPQPDWRIDDDELEQWLWIETSAEAIRVLEAGGVVEVSLDHDLGDEVVVGTCYDVLRWNEKRVALDRASEHPYPHPHLEHRCRDRMESAIRGIANLLARRRADL
jgi:hypothetical protein